MSQKAIDIKKERVAELAEKMTNAPSFVILDYLGLTVDEVTKLRVQLRDAGCEMNVIKNNIIRRAAKTAGFPEMTEHLLGPNAVAFSNEDSVSAAKIVYEFAKDHKELQLKVGVVDGVYMDYDKISQIAIIPSREALLTMFAGGILQPVKEFAIGLSLHIENLEQGAQPN